LSRSSILGRGRIYPRGCCRTRSGVGVGVKEEGSGGLGLDVAHDLEAAPVMVYDLELRWSRGGDSSLPTATMLRGSDPILCSLGLTMNFSSHIIYRHYTVGVH
jgi:hypothetical protein